MKIAAQGVKRRALVVGQASRLSSKVPLLWLRVFTVPTHQRTGGTPVPLNKTGGTRVPPVLIELSAPALTSTSRGLPSPQRNSVDPSASRSARRIG